jgi:HAD superfamily hydrolase (TIGR01509 family)
METPPDTLNRVGVLTRREIEARIVAPLVEALGAEFGRERVVEIVRATIARVAEQQGAALAEQMGGDSLLHLADSMEAWTRDDALRVEVLERSESKFAFNVTRCRYAEMYRALGIPELGAALSCNRDGALICGFNPRAHLQRTQTIMEGASHCDFRYEKPAFDAVIFDMDGLMFDTESIYCETSTRASGELGFPFDDVFYKANFVGKRLVDSEKFLLSHFGPAYPIDAYRERSGQYLREAFTAGVPVKPGLHELLDWLEERRIPKVVATSTARELALLTLGKYAARFDSISTGDEVVHGKPAPDIFLLAAQRAGAPPERCLVLEDSSAGVRAGHAAGANVVWVPDLQSSAQPEVAALAMRVCATLHELPAIVVP